MKKSEGKKSIYIGLLLISLLSISGLTYYYFKQPMLIANHFLQPAQVFDERQYPTTIDYNIVRFPHDKISYVVNSESNYVIHKNQEKIAKDIDFDDSESDDGYRLGFTYKFIKHELLFYYEETNEEYFNKRTTSIAEQTYRIDDQGKIGKLIKQKVNLSQDDKHAHRTKKGLLKKLNTPKNSVKYLLSRRIDFNLLKEKVAQDIKEGNLSKKSREFSDY